MAFCLTPQAVEKMKKAFIDGELSPEKLALMTSIERRANFAKILGDDVAKEVNALFESKLLLKNQKQGMITWAEKTIGMRPEAKRDIISRINRMDKILSPAEETAFLEDLASKRLGVDVTKEEAEKIVKLSEKVKSLENYANTKERVEYGFAQLDLTEYVNSLSTQRANIVTNLLNLPRSIMASLDLSAPLNQGWGMISRKQFYTAITKMFSYAKSPENLKKLQADIITRPIYKTAKKAGLRLTDLGNKLEQREEQFMSRLVDKIPGIAASQRAYTGFLNRLRIDVFEDLIKKAEVAGEDISIGSKAAEDIAKVVNNFTGGARVGKLEQATPILNAVFFSPRKITSTMQMLNPVNYINPKISKTARLAATRNLLGSLAMSVAIIGLARLLGSDEPETDSTSSKFGKVKSGDATLDVTGGNASYAILLSRLLRQKIKGSSGVSRELGSDFGQTSGFDLIAQFLRYKLSPNASFIISAVSGANAIGEKKSIPQLALDQFKPLFLGSLKELIESDSKLKAAFVVGGLFGGGLNAYNPFIVDWNDKTTKEMIKFKQQLGQENFDKANDYFNEIIKIEIDKLENSDTYQGLSDENKQKEITKVKNKAKEDTFNKFNFKP